MSLYVITNHEEEALRGLPHLAQLLYYKLRARMNFRTGIVGDVADRAVSWLALREDLDAWGGPGVKRDLPSEDRVRRAMGHLIRKGLVASIGSKLLLRFRLLKAKTVSLAPKKPAGPTTGHGSGRKGKPVKAQQAYPQGNSEREAATHKDQGNFLKPTPPTPSGLRPDGDGDIDPSAPAALPDDNPPDETPGAVCRQQLSEERHEHGSVGGRRPSAGRSDEGAKPDVSWERHLDWPTGVTQRQRAYMVRSRGGLTSIMFQRVLDEWQGATRAGVVKNAWPYFNRLLKSAKAQGEAWETIYAAQVAEDRAAERQRLAMQMSREREHAARMEANVVATGGGFSGPPAGLGDLVRFQVEDAAAKKASRERRR